MNVGRERVELDEGGYVHVTVPRLMCLNAPASGRVGRNSDSSTIVAFHGNTGLDLLHLISSKQEQILVMATLWASACS